jgi:hypothetical protein
MPVEPAQTNPEKKSDPIAAPFAAIADAVIDQIAYCSVASPSVSALGLVEFIRAANAAQSIAHISGLLMWEGRLMIHWMEGPSQALDQLWAEIQNDPRQHGLVPLLHRRGVEKRLFDRWHMQPASRNEMMAIVREAKEQAGAQSLSQSPAQSSAHAHAEPLQHAIGALSILLNPDLTAFYAQTGMATGEHQCIPSDSSPSLPLPQSEAKRA